MGHADGPWAALLPVVEALDALAVAWHVGGSVASSLHGVFRSTNDVDVVADLAATHAAPLASALAPTHACDAEWIADAVRRHGSFNAIHHESGFKVDVFVPRSTGFTRSVMARRIRIPVAAIGRDLFVASAEDVIVQKLRCFRDGGEVSQRQWSDVLGVIALQGPALDREVMDRWARDQGVVDLLSRALSEPGGPPDAGPR